MEKLNILLIFLLIIVVLVFQNCKQRQPIKQEKLSTFYIRDVIDSTKIKTIILKSEKLNPRARHLENIDQLTNLLYEKEYSIVSVRTFYSDNYIDSVRIKYSTTPKQLSFKLRFKFLDSDKEVPRMIEKDILSKHNAFLDDINYGFLSVNTITLHGFVVAAEIFYYENNEMDRINTFFKSTK